MPGIGKLVGGVSGPAPKLGFWKNQWLELRQSFAFIAMMYGATWAFLGALFILDALSPKPMMPPTFTSVVISAGLTWVAFRVCRWGYRTLYVKTLNEMGVIAIIMAALAAYFTVSEHKGPATVALAVTGCLAFSAALFYLAHLRSHPKKEGP